MIKLTSTHNEMAEWFVKTYPDLVESMDKSKHAYDNESINPYHFENRVLSHTWMVFKLSEVFPPTNHLVKWSSLLHDIGKPLSQEFNHEKKRVRFIGHEGLSAYMAIDILHNVDMPVKDKTMIFKIIALHGVIRNYIDDDRNLRKEKFLKDFRGEKTLLENVIRQVQADTHGRFGVDKYRPLIELIGEFRELISQLSDGNKVEKNDKPTMTMLIGPPNCGKSTWVNENHDNQIILSRDNLVEEAGAKRGLNYTETFDFLNKNRMISKEEVDGKLTLQALEARKNGNDVICDLTNMSKKTRRRWINDFSSYNKNAVVFLTGFEEIKGRNTLRANNTGKFIPEGVLKQMCQNFSLPLYSEGFDQISYVWG